MSLILDALRKSEAERRRGQAPDLFAPIATRAAPRSKQPVAVIVVALVTILAAAAIVFWPGQPSRKSTASGDTETTAIPAHEDVTPIATMPITTSASVPAPKPRAAVSAEIIRKPIEVKPIAVNPPPEIPAASIHPPAAIVDGSAAPPIPDLADTGASDNEPALPTLATLDSATRATLPPLQLSMHVWNQDATRRFAIIDGQRLGEGGKLAGAVVAEIRRDGVVLDIGGRQFLLPRP